MHTSHTSISLHCQTLPSHSPHLTLIPPSLSLSPPHPLTTSPSPSLIPSPFTPPAPTGTPTKVTVDCQSHAVVISWCVPEKKDRNGQITGFKVELHSQGQAAQERQVARTKRCGTTTFRGLLAGKMHHVRVKALNAAGEGPFSEFLQARTKETGEQVLLTLSFCAMVR